MTTHRILVTGGAGYIGARLVPRLLSEGHRVTVLDILLFGRGPLAEVAGHPGLTLVRGDIRDAGLVRRVLAESRPDVVIHLAAISNDPSSDLDPELTTSINHVACADVMHAAKEAGVRRFLYASSASVYGIKEVEDVHEGLELEPITLYAKFKAEGEQVLWSLIDDDFVGVAIRAATVCGWSPRMRLDLTINILTEHAVRHGRIRVFGGAQSRPNVHIDDLVDAYVTLMDAPAAQVQGEAFNICRENSTVMNLAERVRAVLGGAADIVIVPTDDNRSYHLTGGKITRHIGWTPARSLDEAIVDVAASFSDGRIPAPDEPIHRNVRWMTAHPEVWTAEDHA